MRYVGVPRQVAVAPFTSIGMLVDVTRIPEGAVIATCSEVGCVAG
jgi:hypothetical protein